jgi:hypothetical protein
MAISFKGAHFPIKRGADGNRWPLMEGGCNSRTITSRMALPLQQRQTMLLRDKERDGRRATNEILRSPHGRGGRRYATRS